MPKPNNGTQILTPAKTKADQIKEEIPQDKVMSWSQNPLADLDRSSAFSDACREIERRNWNTPR